MWVRRRLDIGWLDLAYGAWRCVLPGGCAATDIERQWAGDAHALVCLSVRSGFDLLLRALALPPGSEVLMSALNVPGMFRVVAENGLTPVPLDIDGDTLAPSLDAVRRAITPRTRMVVVAHLFGAELDQGALRALARRRGVLVVEDRAQAFAGVPTALPPGCDAALASFGAIKTATALGGAVVALQSAALAARMRDLAGEYPVQSRLRYLLRLGKHAGLKALSYRWTFGALVMALTKAGRDYDAWMRRQVRGFDDAGLLAQIRQRPCAALTALLARRLRRYDAGRAERQRQRGAWLALRLPALGKDAPDHRFDLFAIRVPDPAAALAALRGAGFDAGMRGSLVAAEPPAGHARCDTEQARRLLAETIFLPLYPAMPDAEVRRMAAVLANCRPPASGLCYKGVRDTGAGSRRDHRQGEDSQ